MSIDPMAGEIIKGRCPHCGAIASGHHCHVPLLLGAIAVEVTPHERFLIAWLASCLDRSDAAAFADLFIRIRAESAKAGAVTRRAIMEEAND